MVTRTGLEGGPVYTLGSAIRDAVDTDGRCGLAIDLHPDLTGDGARDRLRPAAAEGLDVDVAAPRRSASTPSSIGLLREADAATCRRRRPRSPRW